MLFRNALVALVLGISLASAVAARAGGGDEASGTARSAACRRPINAIAVSQTTPSPTLVVGTPWEIFSSTDSGRTWLQAGAPEVFVYALAVSASAPSKVYAGTPRGVLRSTDAGRTFAPAGKGPSNPEVLGLTVDPTNPATLYAGTNGGGIFKSTDWGDSWTDSGLGLTPPRSVNTIVVDPSSPRLVYAGLQTGGVYRSTDAGASWAAANAVVPSGEMTHLAVRCLTIDPTAPKTLHAGTQDGAVYRTTDGGLSWAAANRGLETHTTENGQKVIFSIWGLVLDPRAPSTLYAGTLGGGVFRSSDSGRTWAHHGVGLVRNSALAIDPGNPSTLYAGTTKGLFRSTDSGETWGPACVE